MYKEEQEKKIGEMTSTYKIIYKIVFKYGIFLLAIGLGMYFAQYTNENTAPIVNITDNDINQKLVMIKGFKKGLPQVKSNGKLTVYVGLGQITSSGSLLSTNNNMVSYNGYILPRYFSGNTDLFTNNKQFEEATLTNEKVDEFLTKFLAIDDKERIASNRNTILPLNNDLVTTFNLQCLSQTKIYNGLCEMFTDSFVKTFIVYNVETDIVGFRNVFNELKDDNKYRSPLCENLILHAYYTDNTSEDIKSIIKMCGTNEYDRFSKFALFSEVQKELESKTISKIIYADKVVNSYKTNSFLQIMYEDVNNERVSINRISNYLTFIENLMKNNGLDSIQTNIIYYFNNYKLKPILENPELSMKMGSKTDVNTLIKRINTINNGDNFMGYKGLKYTVNENILIERVIENIEGVEVESYTTTIEKLLEQITNFSIEEKIISGNQVLTKGTLAISSKGLKINLPIKIQFEEQSSVLYVKRVDIGGQIDMTETINGLVATEQRSLSDFQKYANDNINLFIAAQDPETKETKTFCDIVGEAFSGSNVGSGQETLEKCNENGLTVSRIRNDKKIEIIITYRNYSFKDIYSPYENAQTKITEYLKDPKIIGKYASINESNMINFTKDVLKIFDTAEDVEKPITEYEASKNTLIVIETIKKYFKTNITDIAEKNDKIMIAFTISGINLIGNYNINTRTIEQFYFRDIAQDGIPALIKKTQMVLDDNNMTEIKKFIADPLTYFKDQSIENYLLYLQNTQ